MCTSSLEVDCVCHCWIDRFLDMVKTNQNKIPRVGSASRGKRPALAHNKDFQDRMSKFQRQPWIVEKDIDVPSLVEIYVPGVVATCQWVEFVQGPPKPIRSIVAELYASLIPEKFLRGRPVLVQVVEVHSSPDAINHYFMAPEVQVNNNIVIDTIDDNDQYIERLADVLRMDGRVEWNRMVRLYQRNLRVDAAFWNIFLSYSLRLMQHHTKLLFEPVQLNH
ncbi:hypothetical protein Ddye_012620 [Dipteronia dyeriana]|uniref:Uncharacterized protein n=1 Tax=Dipteronia dyeriana TaxID=168575 RepID=A0AAE0CIV6_9ROSI|nr:hypothetical protein Ddye_012620 [Dipteronia dyeriana]